MLMDLGRSAPGGHQVDTCQAGRSEVYWGGRDSDMGTREQVWSTQGLTDHSAALLFYSTCDEKSQEDFKQGIMGSILCFQRMALALQRTGKRGAGRTRCG